MNLNPCILSSRKDMKIVNRFIGIVFFCFAIHGIGAQTTSEKLKKEQDRLEQKIQNTKLLLDKTKSNTEATLNELKVIENQVQFREALVRNFDNQIRGAEITIVKKDAQIKELQEKLARLKKQYRDLLIYAYKHRNKYGKMMYIVSSDNYFEAIKRKKYLEKISEVQKKQFLIIRQNQKLIGEEIVQIDNEKKQKLVVLSEKKKEREAILVDKVKQQEVYNKFKNDEAKLYAQLKEDERKKENLKEQIAAAIRKEIAEAEAKRKREEERRRKAAEAAKIAAKKANKPVENTEVAVALDDAREGNIVDKNFEANRGRLPWPVDKGTITEGFGRNAHPTLDNVFTNNNGIDITSPKNAEVRSVFEGEVTSVLNIPGAGKVIIIKHGNYRTVYSNLQNTYVNVGSKVDAKQAIGSLLVKPDNNLSVVHFEIHQVVGSNVQSLNPSIWVAR